LASFAVEVVVQNSYYFEIAGIGHMVMVEVAHSAEVVVDHMAEVACDCYAAHPQVEMM